MRLANELSSSASRLNKQTQIGVDIDLSVRLAHRPKEGGLYREHSRLNYLRKLLDYFPEVSENAHSSLSSIYLRPSDKSLEVTEIVSSSGTPTKGRWVVSRTTSRKSLEVKHHHSNKSHPNTQYQIPNTNQRMTFKSINPYNDKEVGEYESLTSDQLNEKLNNSAEAFNSWRKVSLEERCRLMKKAGQVLRDGVDAYAEMISLEMGKPLKEAKAEVNKCAWVCDYYADNAAEFLAEEIIETDAQKSLVRHDPIGAVFAVMPWNFPFWQVLRFAAPTLVAGNVGLLKHAPNVFGSAEMIEDVFTKAGFPKGVFQNLIVHHDVTEDIIKHDIVRAVTLTGSERAGSAVAALAGKYLKKTLLELGGNNAFIVWEDADINEAVKTALTARMLNCGQSCIAAKRFILVEGIYDEFVEKFVTGIRDLKAGDPMHEGTQVGPLARKDLADQLQEQVQKSVKAGAELLIGGNQKEAFHEPTVLGNVRPGMPAFDEETFGPLAAMIKAKDIDEAFALSELSRYGLGVTVCTKDVEKALSMSDRVSDGAYFINELVKSDPRLPFGGTKLSGYGRELSKDGMMEFINRKTVYLK